jgi:type IV pilus assembly protein PilW
MRHIRSSHRLSAGFSLIELLISMIIGLVVIGAMFAAYVGTGLSSRNTRAMSQITEDASIAFSVMRSAIASTGYITPVGSGPNGYTGANGDGRAGTLRGCSNAFSDPDVALTALDCEEGDGPHAIAVSYEADAQNSAVSSDGVPLDCLGNEITAVGTTYPAYQRFFISNNSLRCQGPANNEDQALVDNVVDMQIQYGVACDPAAGGPNLCSDPEQAGRVVRYMDAQALRDEADDLFNWVLAVRLCVTVASADDVLDTSAQYVNCAGAKVDPPGGDTDRKMYRSFTTTIVLHNRLEGVL